MQESTSLLPPDPSTFTSVLRPTEVKETTGLYRDYWHESWMQNGAHSELYQHIHYQSSGSYCQVVNDVSSIRDLIPESDPADKILFLEREKKKISFCEMNFNAQF